MHQDEIDFSKLSAEDYVRSVCYATLIALLKQCPNGLSFPTVHLEACIDTQVLISTNNGFTTVTTIRQAGH
jgi:hypothetical protein